tara:strand:- start:890 stop:1165 length:276 start_codon:yes stop_codon:yes gene_type:complete
VYGTKSRRRRCVIGGGFLFSDFHKSLHVMDALTNEAIDLICAEDAPLNQRVFKPLRRKVFPYIACFAASNIMTFLAVVFIAMTLAKKDVQV